MKHILFVFVTISTISFTAPAQAALFGKLAECTRVDNNDGSTPVSFYILTSALDGDFSAPNDGLIVLAANEDLMISPADFASLVDIVLNEDGSLTIPDDGIYGDSYTFKEGEATENVGVHATYSCGMAEFF